MYEFDAKKEKDKLVFNIQNWFERNGRDCKAVIGISGGKDSTIVAALCVEALGKERVIGVMMPNGIQNDIADSYKVCEELGIQNYEIGIYRAYSAILDQMDCKKNNIDISEQAKINLAPRLRMSTLYAVAQSVNGRVVNTSNYSEYMLGFFTKFGDECGDVKPLLNFTKTEVVEIGKLLPVSRELIEKAPSDGLTGKSDEDKFGFTYEVLDKYLREGVCEDENVLKLIKTQIEKTSFKRTWIPGGSLING